MPLGLTSFQRMSGGGGWLAGAQWAHMKRKVKRLRSILGRSKVGEGYARTLVNLISVHRVTLCGRSLARNMSHWELVNIREYQSIVTVLLESDNNSLWKGFSLLLSVQRQKLLCLKTQHLDISYCCNSTKSSVKNHSLYKCLLCVSLLKSTYKMYLVRPSIAKPSIWCLRLAALH